MTIKRVHARLSTRVEFEWAGNSKDYCVGRVSTHSHVKDIYANCPPSGYPADFYRAWSLGLQELANLLEEER